jgi:uridine kinase
MTPETRRVILLAGPSGAGKSRLAGRLGLPVLQLDDYYKDGDDTTLPHFTSGAVDWDDAASWSLDDAMNAVRQVCSSGATTAPIYDISASARVGERLLDAGRSRYFVAEGIFAAELVKACEAEDLLAAAICVRRSRWLTFALRLTRDLRERRKPPLFLIRRGWWLARREDEIVADLVAKGCTPMTPGQAERRVMCLLSA